MWLQQRYELKGQIGGGAFGITYLATDHGMPSKPDCIIKKLNYTGSAENWEHAKRLFNEEAIALETLGKHSQIPSLYQYFTETNAFYLALEYIPGATLDEELQQHYKNFGKYLDETQVRQLLREILEVLSVVHQSGIIHRDLKPTNIMRRATDKRLVLIDFGAVKRITTDFLRDPDTVVVGTEGYMPYEQIKGKPKLASDVYAVGMIALEALTGRDPINFELDDDNQVIWHNYRRLSREFSNFLNTALAPTIRHRYASAGHALAELKRLESDNFVEPIPDPIPIPPIPIDDSKRGGTLFVEPPPPPEPGWWEEALTWLGTNGLSLVQQTGRVGWELLIAVGKGILELMGMVLEASLKTIENAQTQGIPMFWLAGLCGSYVLVGLWQTGGEVIILQSGDSDAQETIWFTRIFWVLFLTGGGPLLGAGTEKRASIVASVALAWALAGTLAWALAGALALAWAGALALAWALALAVALAVAGAVAVAGAWAWAGAVAWAWAGAYFGTQLWISIVSYLWAIGQPENDVRWLSWVMAILSFLLGSFCFYQANQEGEPILAGVILGAGVMGIMALVVATLVGAGRHLRATGLGYWQRWFWLAVPAVLGVVVGWRSYGVFPWAEWVPLG